MASRKRSMPDEVDKHALYKEWDEASCAICMDHPHNAVLLLCSSHDKGCRSYICDTSYRHSNCLDRLRKVTNEKCSSSAPRSVRRIPSLARFRSRRQNFTFRNSNGNLGLRTPSSLSEFRGELDASSSDALVTNAFAGGSENGTTITNNHMEMNEGALETSDTASASERGPEAADADYPSESKLNLRCPLCRGSVLGWKVMEEARKYLDLKPRSCCRESCSFVGNYRELRRHARRVHPTARPADVDPSRERAWRRLEDQREYDDIVSAIHNAMPGAIVLGDYVIENGDRLLSERGIGESGRLFSTFFLFQMIGSMDPTHEPRGGRSRALSRYRRSNGPFSRRRFLWGENLLGLHYDDDDNDDGNNEDEDEHDLNMSNDLGDNGSNPRRRRRLMRSRSDEDQD